jgi:hypothetical protein
MLWLFVSWQLHRVAITPIFDHLPVQTLSVLGVLWLIGVALRRPRLSDTAIALAVMALFSIPGLLGQYAALSLNRPWADAWLASMDESLGFSMPAIVAWLAVHKAVFYLLLVPYMSFVLQVILVPIFVAWRTSRERLWTYALTYQAAWTLALLGCALWPTEFAFVHYGYTMDPTHFLGAEVMIEHVHRARTHVPWSLPLGATTGLISFPSFHTVLGVLVLWSIRGQRNAISALLLVINVGLILGTAFLGAHYFVDVIASLVMMPFLLWAAQRASRSIESNGARRIHLRPDWATAGRVP